MRRKTEDNGHVHHEPPSSVPYLDDRQPPLGWLSPACRRHHRGHLSQVRHHLDAADREPAHLSVDGAQGHRRDRAVDRSARGAACRGAVCRAGRANASALPEVPPSLRRPADLRCGPLHPCRARRPRCLSVLPQSDHPVSAGGARGTRPHRHGRRNAAAALPANSRARGRLFPHVVERRGRARPGTARRFCPTSIWSGPTGRARRRPNVLMVHYRDLKADLAGEMRRVARISRYRCPRRHFPAIGRGGNIRGDAPRRRQAHAARAQDLRRRRRPLLLQGRKRSLARCAHPRRRGALRGESERRACRRRVRPGSSAAGSARAIHATPPTD